MGYGLEPYCCLQGVQGEMTRPEAERLAVLETQMSAMGDDVAEIRADLKELLALRHKGAGMFQLAAALYGTGIVGALFAAWKWLSS